MKNSFAWCYTGLFTAVKSDFPTTTFLLIQQRSQFAAHSKMKQLCFWWKYYGCTFLENLAVSKSYHECSTCRYCDKDTNNFGTDATVQQFCYWYSIEVYFLTPAFCIQYACCCLPFIINTYKGFQQLFCA